MTQYNDFDDEDLITTDSLLEPQNQNLPSPNTKLLVNGQKSLKQVDLSRYFGRLSTKKPAEKANVQPKKTEEKRSVAKETLFNETSKIEESLKKDEEEEKIDFDKLSIQKIPKQSNVRETPMEENSEFESSKINPDSSKSLREYQFHIIKTCLFDNTLVCLPTGLGKSFVAANVILNYYNWFPEGKIFFLAPTRPLVTQQKTAPKCLKEINPNDVLELTANVPPKKREEYYKEKRLFFMTPQIIDNDLQNKLIDPTKIVLIIFDEAHRAVGKYSYINIVRSINQENNGYRIVALSALPGNKEVLENLNISRLEAKDEKDSDVRPDVKEISIITTINDILNEILMKQIKLMNKLNLFPPESEFIFKEPEEINRTRIRQLLEEFNSKIEEYTMLIGPENRSLLYEIIGIITSLCHAKKKLNEKGVPSFIVAIGNFKSNIKTKYGFTLEYKKRLLDSPEFKKLNECVKRMLVSDTQT